ncbi:hypothetical protein VA596_18535 [Amycolatopsis sp., V23-08]|uniref:PH domain-containing protein n=1 Tax=Amycolatopsis heterodermiae TaxID=3110235 RepID=A0ABU5R5N7_9PSEU|nr:hypothetical protein [Amycolatopsis sp., V23-08]MEA5361547.1 hypothetical protein [Amycolatopsis sp., V23-08]
MEPYPLQAGERVLWAGAPVVRRHWLYENYVLLFGTVLLVGGFVVVDWMSGRYLSLLSAAVFAFWAAWGPRLRNRRARLDVETYFVTDRRIVFVAQWPTGAEFRWVWLNRLQPARARVGDDGTGTGTVTFGTPLGVRWRLLGTPHQGAWVPFTPELWAIPDAERVAALIRQAQSGTIPKRAGNILETPSGPRA